MSDGMEAIELDREAYMALEQYNNIIHNLPVVPYVCKAYGDFGAIFASERIFVQTGYKPNQLTSDSSFWLNNIHPEDRNRVHAQMSKVFDQNELRYEYRWRISNGEYRWFQDFSRLVRGEDGKPKYIVGAWYDITERMEREVALAEARDEAIQANKEKSLFLARMSHELRTPLNAILGFAQLEKLDLVAEDKSRLSISLDHIIHGGQYLLGMINDILDIVKIEQNQQIVNLESCAVGEIISESIELVRHLAGQFGISVFGDDSDLYVLADSMRLKQVVINLLTNAIKYNQKNGHVTIKAEMLSDDIIEISILDTGVGIEKMDLAAIFEPFTRLQLESKNYIEGSGIGLSVTKSLIEQMGGSIGVESEKNKGTTFKVQLPQGNKKSTSASTSPKPRKRDNYTPKLFVLYVEDDWSSVRLIETMLSAYKNITLVTARTAEEGIEIAKTQKPDLIFLDINLPEMDGISAVKILREISFLQKTQIVALSAAAMNHQIEAGLVSGFDQYLIKPLELDKFMAVIDGM